MRCPLSSARIRSPRYARFGRRFPKGNERAGLIIKTRHADQVAGNDLVHWKLVLKEAEQDKRIRIVNRTLSEAELTGLLGACDCYVTLHRSEGFGYGAAEALIQGKPVITTNYSGVCDFCTDETSLLVPYELKATEPGAYPIWIMTDRIFGRLRTPRLLAIICKGCSGIRLRAGSLGEQGQRLIRAKYSIQALSARYQERLAELGFCPIQSSAK